MCNNGTDLESIGERIKKARKKLNMTQDELAKELHCKREVVSYYENGSREIKTGTLIELSKILGVSTDYLLGLSTAETKDVEISGICNYTGLNENSVEFLSKLNSYKIGNSIEYPAENDKWLLGMITCEYDMPMYIVNLLLNNPQIIGLIQSYLCMLNDEHASSYQGDKGNTILFELMLKLRMLRDEFQPIYKEAFYKHFNKDGVNNGNNK